MKRFYKSADVAEAPGGWTVALDAKPIKTPAKRPFIASTRAMAEASAEEWAVQEDDVKPQNMPVTKAINTALDRTAPEYDAVAQIVSEYGGSDLICYRATDPQGLIARQQATWDPLIAWADEALNARLVTTAGIMHILQPEDGQNALAAKVREFDPFELTGLYDLVALSGSLIIGLAVAMDRLSHVEGWAASRVDNTWQEDQWGVDEEAAAQAAYKAEEFAAAARLIKLARAN